ncbi:hypothetical protein TRVA0_019S01772 [Trichomonascus vanleenenianus]|uniref:heme-dependent oxidative N-demethylase family protein n=1 Tax=Trichomonascus vanleenenianus TaxID=2268995 RepID=UPI003ECA5ACA
MGIRRLDPEGWLLIEDTYKKVVEGRRKAAERFESNTVLYHPVANEALKELHTTVLDFLVKRYPQYFVESKDGKHVDNLILGTLIERDSNAYQDMNELIKQVALNIEEDFLIMIYNEEDDTYYLRGGSFLHPSGFNPRDKLNQPLAAIHGPIPFYREKLQLSMDRYFKKMRPGQWIERFNWTLQGSSALYAPPEYERPPKHDLTPEKIMFRCERQTLTRLPKSQAIVFTIRTYMTPLPQLCEQEGLGDVLLDALDNLPPQMADYKGMGHWGDTAMPYLKNIVQQPQTVP